MSIIKFPEASRYPDELRGKIPPCRRSIHFAALLADDPIPWDRVDASRKEKNKFSDQPQNRPVSILAAWRQKLPLRTMKVVVAKTRTPSREDAR